MKFSHSFRVAAEDIDEQGHVNNVAYLKWIQDIAVAHWRHSASEEQLAKYSWVTVRHEVDYKKQAFENEEITGTTWSVSGRMLPVNASRKFTAAMICWSNQELSGA